MTKANKHMGIERVATLRRHPAPEPERRPSRRRYADRPWEAWVCYHYRDGQALRAGRYAKEEHAVMAALKHMRWLDSLYRRPHMRPNPPEHRGRAYVVQPDGSCYTPLE